MKSTMKSSRFASVVLAGSLLLPVVASAQTVTYREHERAKAAQRASDHRHHTGAKIVGGSAVGGAVIGGLAGGGKGALIGGALGAGGGALYNKHRENKDIRAREREHRY